MKFRIQAISSYVISAQTLCFSNSTTTFNKHTANLLVEMLGTIIIIRVTCQFHLKWVARLLWGRPLRLVTRSTLHLTPCTHNKWLTQMNVMDMVFALCFSVSNVWTKYLIKSQVTHRLLHRPHIYNYFYRISNYFKATKGKSRKLHEFKYHPVHFI